MKHIFFFILFNFLNFSSYSQAEKDSIYQTEVNRIQKKIEINVMHNMNLFCDSYIGSTLWIVISKNTILNESKLRVLTTDQSIRNKFEILKKYEIDINWNIIDNNISNVIVIQPVAVTCLEQERVDYSSLFALYTMLNTIPDYAKSKMILFKTISFDIGPSVSKSDH